MRARASAGILALVTLCAVLLTGGGSSVESVVSPVTRSPTMQRLPMSHVFWLMRPKSILPKSDATSTDTPHWACIQTHEGRTYASGGMEPHGGMYQFDVKTWLGLGFSGLPNKASPAVQDRAALAEYAEGQRYWHEGFHAWRGDGCGLGE